jgi:hypothetical protein
MHLPILGKLPIIGEFPVYRYFPYTPFWRRERQIHCTGYTGSYSVERRGKD